MQKLKFIEMKNKSEKELKELLSDLRHEIMDLKMRAEGTSLKNVKQVREARKGIARALTVLSAK